MNYLDTVRSKYPQKTMSFNIQKGNIVLEYLVYILICIFIFQGFLNFLLISIKRNEMARISNFISFSITQDPTKLSSFTITDQDVWLKALSSNSELKYVIYCGDETCSTNSDFVKITLYSHFEYLFFEIPLTVSSQYQMGKFLSKT